MKKEKGLKLLNLLQCMFQQKIISVEEKNELAVLIKEAMKTGSYQKVVSLLMTIEWDNDCDEYIAEAIEIAEK